MKVWNSPSELFPSFRLLLPESIRYLALFDQLVSCGAHKTAWQSAKWHSATLNDKSSVLVFSFIVYGFYWYNSCWGLQTARLEIPRLFFLQPEEALCCLSFLYYCILEKTSTETDSLSHLIGSICLTCLKLQCPHGIILEQGPVPVLNHSRWTHINIFWSVACG